MEASNNELKRERDKAVQESEDVSDRAARRQDELRELNDERKALVQRLSDSESAKFNALLRSEDVASKEKSLEIREKRLTEDRELMQNYINNLREDLHEANDKNSQVPNFGFICPSHYIKVDKWQNLPCHL